jgi:NADPH:quinone reductase-like Zn-dependent oxidoreductase
MKAIILHEAGGVENLQIREVDKPGISDSEVLIKVKSISINPVDVKARAYDDILSWIFGKERPIILGWDISGEVVEKGTHVTSFKVGDEVFGMVNFFGNGKAYAEYVASPASHLALKPKNVTHQEAAAATMVASTAYQALVDIANIKKGDKVLIHAASGGVGHIAVQIAKYFGAYVIGTSSARNKDFILSLGADKHIDYRKEKFEEMTQNVDIVIDAIQGETLLNSLKVVRSNGVIVTLPSPQIPEIVKDAALEKGINIEFLMVSSISETIKAIAKMLESGVLKAHIHKSFSFEDIGQAHLEVETNHVAGKVIVNV